MVKFEMKDESVSGGEIRANRTMQTSEWRSRCMMHSPRLSSYREKEAATSCLYMNAFAHKLLCHLGELKAKTGILYN